MKLSDYGRAFIRCWWMVLICLVLGVGGALAVNTAVEPKYQSSITFYVVAPSTERQNALQSDELARGRIPGYAELLTSEEFVNRIVSASSSSLEPDVVKESIFPNADPNTLTLTVNVRNPDLDTTEEIAAQIAGTLGKTVNDLESGTSSETVLNVISGPTTSEQPLGPRSGLNLAAGVLLGAAAGVLLVITRTKGDRRIRSEDQLEQQAALPVLASVPADTRSTGRRTAGSRAAGAYLDALRRLRTNVAHYPGGNVPRVIAVTSPVTGDGRTETAIHLALSFAEAEQRVLLVEADLRSPGLARTLQLQPGPGLSDVLTGRVLPADAIRTVGGLDVLAAGSTVPDPAQLLGGSGMHSLLAELRSVYDTVILDTPPLMSHLDAFVVAAAADRTLLVAAYGRTTTEDLSAALRSLGVVRGAVLGTVFNRVPAEKRSGSVPRAQKPATEPAAEARAAQEQPADVPG